ncbi:MAG: IS701 family transposase [Methanosarcinales archaeon]
MMDLRVSDIENAMEELKKFHKEFHRFFITKTRKVTEHALQYSNGLLFGCERKNMTNMEKTVMCSNHQALQHFISNSQWYEEGVINEIQRRISELIGDKVHGSLHFDETGYLKDGKNSVGVKRQYCGRFGKVDNCQVGVFLGYVVWNRRMLIDKRLYLPEDWARDPDRRKRCGVPENIMFNTKAELALDMFTKAKDRKIPFAWVGMDCFYGQQPWLLDRINREGEIYIADVPCDTRVWIDLPKVGIPKRKGNRGPHPKKKQVVEGEPEPIEVQKLAKETPEQEKDRVFLRDTERKELWCKMACLRVYQIRDGIPGPESWLIIRWFDNGEVKYQLSNASPRTKQRRLAEMSCSRYWIERALEDAKGEVGMGDYEVRGWLGWHHHMTMVLLAMLFLLTLQIKWKDKAPMLTIQDVREILEVVLPRRVITKEEILEIIKMKHKARASARKSHHKRNITV